MSSTHRHTSTARKRGKGSVTSSRGSKSNGKSRTASASRSGSKAKSGGTTKKKKSSSKTSASNGRQSTPKKKASSSASRKSTPKKKTPTKAKAGSKAPTKSKAKAPAKKAKAPTKKAKAPAKKAKAPASKAKAPASKAPASKAKAPASKAPASKAAASKAKAPASKAKAAASKVKASASKAKAPASKVKAPPSKAPAAQPSPSASSFDVGDKAVHPAHGVGEITSIESRDIAGTRKAFFILKIIDTGMTVMVPTDGAQRLGLRKVISRDDAKKVLAILQKNEIAVTSQPWNRRYREYMDMLKSGSPYEVAKVLRDLYRLKGDKELSFGERRLLEQARTLLVTELALARRCKEQTVEDEIEGILSA